MLDNMMSALKAQIFGEDNSRLDYFIDYFYSIRQEKRAKIIFYSIISSVVFSLFLLVFYFYGLHSLQKKLDYAVADTNELKMLKTPYMEIQRQFLQIMPGLQSANQVSQVVSALDQTAKSMDIQVANLPSSPPVLDLPSSHPLAQKFQQVRIEYKLSNVSLKRTINYIAAIQQLPNKFKVTKLEISQIFGTRLYFNVNLIVECYVPKSQKK